MANGHTIIKSDQPMVGSSALIPEKVVQVEGLETYHLQGVLAKAVSTWHSGSVTIGPSDKDFVAEVRGWNFSSDYPRQVLCQARQNQDQNFNHGWPDQFVIQVIQTAKTFVRIRIRRVDDGTDSSGWSQNLRVDFLVIE